MVISQKILLFFFFATAYVAFLVSKTKYNFISLYRIVAFSLFLLVLYISMHISYKSSIINFFYVPILLMTLIVSNIRTTAICTVLVILLWLFTPQIALYLGISKPVKSSAEYLRILKILEFVVISFAAYFSLLIMYYYKEFVKIELKYSNRLESDSKTSTKEPVTEIAKSAIPLNENNAMAENDRFEQLYLRIIFCFDNQKPFQDPAFNKKSLANLLQTNETYISKALNQNGDKNFNTLVNEYRINQVINEFDTKNFKKYTIEHIYMRAGFTQQSTFNRVFKEFTGRTPSEYIESSGSINSLANDN
ncbi:MAG: helix-turn-helix domain-containing protein [Flavobacterium sp.]